MKMKVTKSNECFLSEELFKTNEVQKVVLNDIDRRLPRQKLNSSSEKELHHRKSVEELLVRAKEGLST